MSNEDNNITKWFVMVLRRTVLWSAVALIGALAFVLTLEYATELLRGIEILNGWLPKPPS